MLWLVTFCSEDQIQFRLEVVGGVGVAFSSKCAKEGYTI